MFSLRDEVQSLLLITANTVNSEQEGLRITHVFRGVLMRMSAAILLRLPARVVFLRAAATFCFNLVSITGDSSGPSGWNPKSICQRDGVDESPAELTS